MSSLCVASRTITGSAAKQGFLHTLAGRPGDYWCLAPFGAWHLSREPPGHHNAGSFGQKRSITAVMCPPDRPNRGVAVERSGLVECGYGLAMTRTARHVNLASRPSRYQSTRYHAKSSAVGSGEPTRYSRSFAEGWTRPVTVTSELPVEGFTKNPSQSLVCGPDGVGIHPQCHRRVGVTQTVGDGADVLARGDRLCC